MASSLNSPQSWVRVSDDVVVAGGRAIDAGVILGCAPGREISQRALRIGPDARIRSGTVVYAGTTIGARLETGHNVVIREENNIGDDFTIWSNAVVDYGCTIGSRVRVHCGVYVAQFTTIEDDVFLAPGVTLTNDRHPGCPASKQCMRGPLIQKGAQIGANATVLPFVTIGEHAVIGAGSVVTADVAAWAVVCGNPARVLKDARDVVCSTGHTDRPYSG